MRFLTFSPSFPLSLPTCVCLCPFSPSPISRLTRDQIADGFFDAGMLLQALKASGGGGGGPDKEKESGASKPKPHEVAEQKRRAVVGRKLTLNEY